MYALVTPITRSDVPGSNAGAHASSARHRIGGGNERVGAVVEIQEHGLGPFKEHVLASLQGIVKHPHGVGDVRGQAGSALFQVLSATASKSNGSRLYTLASNGFFSCSTTLSFSPKILGSSRSCTRKPTRAALSA